MHLQRIRSSSARLILAIVQLHDPSNKTNANATPVNDRGRHTSELPTEPASLAKPRLQPRNSAAESRLKTSPEREMQSNHFTCHRAVDFTPEDRLNSARSAEVGAILSVDRVRENRSTSPCSSRSLTLTLLEFFAKVAHFMTDGQHEKKFAICSGHVSEIAL